MPEKNVDLHGSAPDKHEIALLLIDVINDFDCPEAEQLLDYARPMTQNLLRLKRHAQKAGVPVIYVNDNFGRWKSDFRRIVERCNAEWARPGRREIIATRRKRLLRAQAEAPWILFYHARDASSLSGNADVNPHRHCWKLLRSFHSQRCLHARLQLVCTLGLHGVEHKERKRFCTRAHEKISEG